MRKKILSIILMLVLTLSASIQVYALSTVPMSSLIVGKEWMIVEICDPAYGPNWMKHELHVIPAGRTFVGTPSTINDPGTYNWPFFRPQAYTVKDSTGVTPIRYEFFDNILSPGQPQGAWQPPGDYAGEIYTASFTGGSLYSSARIIASSTIFTTTTGIDEYNPNPITNYTVNVGQTVKFTLREGKLSESITVENANAKIDITTINSQNQTSTNPYTVTGSLIAGTTKELRVKVNTADGNSVVIKSTMPMTVIGNNGEITPPTNTVVNITNNPDTITIINRTGKTQYIRQTRLTSGDGQQTLSTWSELSGTTYSLVGSSPIIKDTVIRNYPLKTNQNLQIYNNGGTTKVEYPNIDGLTVVTTQRGSTYIGDNASNLDIGTINPGDSPDLQTPLPEPGEYETSIAGFMAWISDTITGLFENILESLQSVVTTVTGFGTKIGSLGQITGDFFGFPAWMVGLITMGITLPIIAGIICRRLL